MDEVNKSVFWTTRATRDLQKTIEFYIELYGKVKAREIALELRQKTETLKRTDVELLNPAILMKRFLI